MVISNMLILKNSTLFVEKVIGGPILFRELVQVLLLVFPFVSSL